MPDKPASRDHPADSSQSGQITRLLASWRAGDPAALNQVLTMVYWDLHRLAKLYLRPGRAAATLQPTALVHEVYRYLMERRPLVFRDRQHFFSTAVLIMRQTLIRHARAGRTMKRGGRETHLPLHDEGTALASPTGLEPETAIVLTDTLDQLARLDARKHQIVALRFFLGLSNDEVACALGTSTRTVKREWRTAKAWIAARLGGSLD